MNLLRKLFDHEYKEMKKFTTLADKVMALDEEYSKLTDTELQNKTEEFRNRLRDGETLDDILVEAFATAREAAFRVLGEKHFYVQILGGLAIHYGNIAEMKTGEGKTLTSVLPAYLNALSGEGVHIITVNEYLATRDADWMGKIHEFLGLTVGVNTRDLSPKEKQEAYNCDILYSTNNEIGFDYLRDNMVVHKEDRVQRKLNFAIIDEVDSVLIDEARTPLIISGGEMKSANLYIDADRFAKSLKDEKDYIYDEKTKNVSLSILRFSQVYGENEPIVRIIPLLIDRIKNNTEFSLYGTGLEKRRFLFVDDAANAIICALRSKKTGVYNIAGKSVESIKDLIDITEKVFNKKLNLKKVDYSGVTFDNIPSIEKASQEIGYEPSFSLQEGIERIYNAI